MDESWSPVTGLKTLLLEGTGRLRNAMEALVWVLATTESRKQSTWGCRRNPKGPEVRVSGITDGDMGYGL